MTHPKSVFAKIGENQNLLVTSFYLWTAELSGPVAVDEEGLDAAAQEIQQGRRVNRRTSGSTELGNVAFGSSRHVAFLCYAGPLAEK